jgi:hypothetical protein
MLGEKIKPSCKGFFAKYVESKNKIKLGDWMQLGLVFFPFLSFPFIVRACGVCVCLEPNATCWPPFVSPRLNAPSSH